MNPILGIASLIILTAGGLVGLIIKTLFNLDQQIIYFCASLSLLTILYLKKQ